MEENPTEEKYDITKIPTKEAPVKFDADLYEGQRAPISEVEIKKVKDYYPKRKVKDEVTGEMVEKQVYDPESTEIKLVVELTTAPLKKMTKDDNGYPKMTEDILTITDKDGNSKPFMVREQFNIQTEDDGTPYISKHPKAALWKYMCKINAKTLEEIKGKLGTITLVPSKKEGDDRRFLSLAK